MKRTLRVVSAICGLSLSAIGGLFAQEPALLSYAITNARIVPVSGAIVENGTIVLRDGLIAQIETGLHPPAGSVVIDGKGLTVYPGLIDMGSTAGLDVPAPRSGNPQTTEDV